MTHSTQRKTLDQTIAAIEALDLTPIKFKACRQEDGYGWSAGYADQMEVAYKRYLILHAKHPDLTLAPEQDVDRFWHMHILDTRKYAADCETTFGYFLHHFPYLGLRGVPGDAALDRRRIRRADARAPTRAAQGWGRMVLAGGGQARGRLVFARSGQTFSGMVFAGGRQTFGRMVFAGGGQTFGCMVFARSGQTFSRVVFARSGQAFGGVVLARSRQTFGRMVLARSRQTVSGMVFAGGGCCGRALGEGRRVWAGSFARMFQPGVNG